MTAETCLLSTHIFITWTSWTSTLQKMFWLQMMNLIFKIKCNRLENYVSKGNLECLHDHLVLRVRKDMGGSQVLKTRGATAENQTLTTPWPPSFASPQPDSLTWRKKEKLCKLQSDHTFKIKCINLSKDNFSISVKGE